MPERFASAAPVSREFSSFTQTPSFHKKRKPAGNLSLRPPAGSFSVLAQVAHVDAGAITMTLTAFGCSGLLGSWLFGRLFDGHRFPFLAITLSGVPVALLLMGPAASSLVTVLAVCALWGCCATAFNVEFQAELIKHTPADSSAVAMSIFSGLFNLGIGTGTAIGGAVVSGPGIAWIGCAGGAIAAVGVILAIKVMFPAIRRAKPVA